MCLAQYLVNVVKMLNSMSRIWGWESVFGEAQREIIYNDYYVFLKSKK